jgi:hypothetical protein
MRLGAWTKDIQGDEWLEVSGIDPFCANGIGRSSHRLTLQDETLEVYQYTKLAAMIDPGWYSCLDQLSTYALDMLDYKNLVHGDEAIEEDILEKFVLPACFGKHL